jgi:type VI secretion system Hcp family effector
MRVFSSLIASLVTGAVLMLAPQARADGFFITFASASKSTPRIAGSVFSAPTAPPVSAANQAAKAVSAHVEIDDWMGSIAPLLDDIDTGQRLTVTVEFTAPNAQGQEQVYMVATFKDAALSGWTGTFTVGGSPQIEQSIDFSYQVASYRTPAAAPASRLVILRPLPTLVPRITRSTLKVAALPVHVDDAYILIPSFPGEGPEDTKSSDHTERSRLTRFSWTTLSPVDSATGMASGKRQTQPVVITKPMGTATPFFKSAQASGKILSGVKIYFVQHHAGAADSNLIVIEMANAKITGDTIQANGSSQSESVTLTSASVDLSDKVSNVATSDSWTAN